MDNRRIHLSKSPQVYLLQRTTKQINQAIIEFFHERPSIKNHRLLTI